MDSILQKDIQKLIRDAEKIQRGLDMLEHDHGVRAIQCQQNDLMQLIEHAKRLEFDVNTILSDCVSLGRKYWKHHDLSVIYSLHRSFATLNTLFDDLKKVRFALSEAHINPSDLQQLVIDWVGFKKSIDQTRRLMQHPHKRRKNHGWFSAGRQRRGAGPGVDSVHPAVGEAPGLETSRTFEEGRIHNTNAFSGQRKRSANINGLME